MNNQEHIGVVVFNPLDTGVFSVCWTCILGTLLMGIHRERMAIVL